MREWPSTAVWILDYSGPQWKGDGEKGDALFTITMPSFIIVSETDIFNDFLRYFLFSPVLLVTLVVAIYRPLQ